MARIDMRKTHRLGMAAVLGLEGYSRTHLPKRLYELVKLRASHLNQCHYCINMHTTALSKDGETPERMAAVATGTLPHPLFDDRENAALILTDHLTRIDPATGISDDVWAQTARHFDETQLGNLVLGIATINVFNRVSIATRLEA
ncbi:carboxymuconolactone decarboxylase family protein [Micrococcus luteus]|uniref:carboxymuconolactone decarboxylase family protein n=1 Tax=Micrococcus luteus TaxID=1270 RepID=UPI0015D73D07|nr:carboxymuconolactone decarboxylase family protein [Micrococcus luteus]